MLQHSRQVNLHYLVIINLNLQLAAFLALSLLLNLQDHYLGAQVCLDRNPQLNLQGFSVHNLLNNKHLGSSHLVNNSKLCLFNRATLIFTIQKIPSDFLTHF